MNKEREALVKLLRECKELADADAMDAKDNLRSSAHAYFNSLCGRLSDAIAALTAQPQQVNAEGREVALNVKHKDCHKAADAFWQYWRENGKTHKRGYYESTWGAINQALRYVGVVPHEYRRPRMEIFYCAVPDDCSNIPPAPQPQQEPSGVREGMLRAAEICREQMVRADVRHNHGVAACRNAITRAADQEPAEGVVVTRDKLERWLEYWNGSNNEKAMSDALDFLLGEIAALLAAAKEPK